MAIRFHHAGMDFVADTPEEAAALVLALREGDVPAQAATRHRHWDHGEFITYLRRLGDTQTTVLAHLILHRKVSDDALRKALGKNGNQAVAGVLSGLSRQAEAMSIDPRDVYTARNWRVRGERRAEYEIAPGLLRVATEANWPPDKEMFADNA